MGTVPTPAQQVASTPVPAATVNAQGNLATYLAGRTEAGGSRRPLARLLQTVAQPISNSSSTAITFDTEGVDYDDGHSTITNTSRYTAQTQGWYLITFDLTWQANGTGSRTAFLRTNGSAQVQGSVAQVPGSSTGQTEQVGSALVFLNVGDYVELMGLQNSGGGINTFSATDNSAMFVLWVSV